MIRYVPEEPGPDGVWLAIVVLFIGFAAVVLFTTLDTCEARDFSYLLRTSPTAARQPG